MAKATTTKQVEKKEGKTKLTIVKFLRAWSCYIKGEVAGFEEDFAKKLAKGGVAEIFKK